MSEVKGTLLGIVLAVSVFAIVFGIITAAIRQASNTVASRINEGATTEADIYDGEATGYTLTY